MKRTIIAAALIVLTAAAGNSAVAADRMNLPAEQHQGTVAFIAGGNSRNVQAFERAATHYPLALELVRRGGHHDGFLPGASVSLRNAHGGKVLSTFVNGPFLLARVPAGRYIASVTYSGKTVRHSILVKPRDNHRVILEWSDGA